MRHLEGDFIKKTALFFTVILFATAAFIAYGAPAKPISPYFTQNTSEHYANGAFSINWTGNLTGGDNISNYTIYAYNLTDFVMNLTNTSENGTLFSAVANNGNYTFNITAVNETGGESENTTTAWIFVDMQNATISLNSPADGLNTTNTTIFFNFTAIDNTEPLNCSLYIDSIYNRSNSTMANNTETLFNATLSEGRHTWNVSCTDRANNTNTSAAYAIGIDLSAPSIILSSPANGEWDTDGKINFTFTAADAATKIDNCSLWTNTTGTWQLNMTNSSVSNNTQTTFVFDNGTNVLVNRTYVWNVQCYDNLSHGNFSSQNYTFIVGNATDFTVTDVRLINSTAAQYNNPVPGSSLTINATIANAGTLNASANITVALFFETTFLSNQTISNDTLTANSSTNITFNISGTNLTGYGPHNIKISADYRNLISESDEANNNMTLVLFSGLNVSANATAGSAIQTPRPGENLSINLTVRYQNGSAVTGLGLSNFTIYDIYTYDNGTTISNRNITINYLNDSQNASGIYFINATAPAKTAANRAEHGNHYIRVKVTDNKSAAYEGWDNRTSNYYGLKAPNLEVRFDPAISYRIDRAYHTIKAFTVQIKNNGTANISAVSVAITANISASLTNNSINYSSTVLCNAGALTVSNDFSTVPSCNLTFNATALNTYRLSVIAGGFDSGSNIYNSTQVTQNIVVENTTSVPAASSGSSDTVVRAKTYSYTIDIANYSKTIVLEQGNRASMRFLVNNTGNGTVNNLSAILSNPNTVSWGNWFNSSKISKLAPKETAYVQTNISVPLSATVAIYTITVNASGKEAGSSKIISFVLQVLPGNDTKKQITISFADIRAQINEINSTLAKLSGSSKNNANLTIASKKLAEAERLRLEAEQAILNSDYFTAYNNKKDIEALLPEIRRLLTDEAQVVEKQESFQRNIIIIALFFIAAAGMIYYMWLPEEGYVPGKGYFKKDPTTYMARLKDMIYTPFHKTAKSPLEAVKEMMNKDNQDAKYLKPKEQPYSYTHKDTGLNISKMYQNLVNQFKEQGTSKEKPTYNFHKKQRWSDD